jgi:hypothetical protein
VPRKTSGLCAVALSLSLALAANLSATVPSSAASSTPWTTYHFDPAHTGNDISEPSMAGVSPSWTSATLDGRVYGEPLALNNTVYVVTQQNTVYALDAVSGATTWSLPLALAPYNLHPVPLATVTGTAGIGGGNIDPMGVIGTPVIDPALGAGGTLFAVAESWDNVRGSSIGHELVAVDLAAHTATHGNTDPHGVGFDTGSTRALEQERGALALAGGHVIVPYGGLAGDQGNYHGFVVSLPENNLSATPSTFEVNKDFRAGGIWAAGGLAVDGAGNIYVATGNGFEPGSSTYEYTDGVVKLDSNMNLLDDFGPTVWRSDDGADADLGSQGPLLISRQGGNPLVFASGKQLTGYLLDSGRLSSSIDHIGGELFSAKACDQESFGASAYSAPYLYVPCGEGLRALQVNTATPTFARAWLGPGDAKGPPIVAGGLVWVHGSGRLYGLDPTSGATIVTMSGVDTAYNFSSPSASGGRLFYAGNNTVRAFTSLAPATGRLWTSTEANGTRDVLQRHADGTITRSRQTTPGHDAGWSAWAALDSTMMASHPAGEANADGRLEAFAAGLDGRLYHSPQSATNGPFAAWSALDGLIIGQPTVKRNRDGTLEVIARGVDNRAYSWRQTSAGTWGSTAYHALGGILTSDPTVGLEANGHLEVFGRGTDTAFWTDSETSLSSDTWSGWSSLGGLGPPGLVGIGSQQDGRQAIFVRGVDNAVWTRTESAPNGPWNGWVPQGGLTQGDIAVDSNNDGRMQIFLRGADNAIWTKAQNVAGVWQGYSTMGGITLRDPVSGFDPSSMTIDVFVIGADNQVWQNYQALPSAAFNGWASLGGGPAG